MSVLGDLAIARQWVGTIPNDTDLDLAIYDAGGPLTAALVILRTRRADLIANPAKWATADDYSEDTTANLKAIDALIGKLEDQVGEASTTGNAFTSTPICGPSMDR